MNFMSSIIHKPLESHKKKQLKIFIFFLLSFPEFHKKKCNILYNVIMEHNSARKQNFDITHTCVIIEKWKE